MKINNNLKDLKFMKHYSLNYSIDEFIIYLCLIPLMKKIFF